jgi:hypothetical protein
MNRITAILSLAALGVALATMAAAAGAFTPAQSAAPVFDPPVLLTSAGQSADVALAATLARRAGIPADQVKAATGKDLAGHKTLVLVLGASMKGLGAAGLETAKEKDRVRALLAEAKSRGVPVLCLHLGGEQRRGELTDEMIGEFLPSARMAVVVASGDKDGLFTRICREKGIVLKVVEKTLDAVEPLKAAFRK